MGLEERAEINQMLSPKSKVSSSLVDLLKTPKKLKVNIDKDDLELSSRNLTNYTTSEVDVSTKPMAEVQRANEIHKDESPEPEIKKRKRGRPNTKEDKTVVPLKKRSSSRSTKGKHSHYHSRDALTTTGSPSLIHLARQKNAVGIVNDDEENLRALGHDVKAKTNAIAPNANGISVTNATPTVLPIQKSLVGTPGTARKRVGGEGKVASLQRIMLELPNLCDPNVFTDILMKTYGSRFEAFKVFECLKTSDLKEAVMRKFTPSELMAIIQKKENANSMLLTMASTEEILHEVKSREELRSSEKMFSLLLTKKALNNDNVVRTVLNAASVDAIVNTVSSRSDLQNCEKLFNLLSQNLPAKISEETKKIVIEVLIEKFTTSELVDISHEAIKLSVDKYQKN